MSLRTPRVTTKTPRTGRRPGASTTRDAILKAAQRLFLERGYQGATMRAIAKEAGVDASLVVHFFDNKIGLFAEAVPWPFEPEEEMPRLLAGGRRQVGRNLADFFLQTWDEEGRRSPILTLVAAAVVEPEAAELLRDFVRERLFSPLLERLESDRPQLRGNLVASQLVGLGLVRYVQRVEPIASTPSAEVLELIAPNLQRYLTGKI